MNPFRTAILLAIGGYLLFSAARRMRYMRLKERHAIVLILTAIPFLILAVWPDLIGRLSAAMDIHYTTVMLGGVSLFFLLVILELLSIVSVLERRVTTLAQMVAILNQKQDLLPYNRGQTEAPSEPTSHASPDFIDP